MKYHILKALDVAGLQVLDPIVRLIYREEPSEQIKRIGLFIVIPLCTLGFAVLCWAYAAPRHTTKSGEVPTPSVVYTAAQGVLTFHQRENIKADDFQRSGQDRIDTLAQVEADLAHLQPIAEAASAEVAIQENAAQEYLRSTTEEINAAYRDKRLASRDASKAREANLSELASAAAAGNAQAKATLETAVEAHKVATAQEAAEIQLLRDTRTKLQNGKFAPLIAARTHANALQEQLQFLRKRKDFLTTENRSLALTAAEQRLVELRATLVATSDPKQALDTANAISRQEEVIASLVSSSYSRPWTLPRQIWRSLLCVFTGFVIATAMAIPVGILCGLSQVFMAAMTPLISLLKPVSPIVWLPIIFIIVGGFILDPSDSRVLDFFNALPLLSGQDINPAFIASALTVALCSLWPTLVNTALGVASIDKDHLNVARVLRLGFTARLFKIVIPSALPLIFAGLRISLGVGWMVLIAAELLSSSEGIGKFVWDMFNNGSSQTFAQMFVVVFVVGAIGLLLDRIMIVCQRLVSFDGAPTAL